MWLCLEFLFWLWGLVCFYGVRSTLGYTMGSTPWALSLGQTLIDPDLTGLTGLNDPEWLSRRHSPQLPPKGF